MDEIDVNASLQEGAKIPFHDHSLHGGAESIPRHDSPIAAREPCTPPVKKASSMVKSGSTWLATRQLRQKSCAETASRWQPIRDRARDSV